MGEEIVYSSLHLGSLCENMEASLSLSLCEPVSFFVVLSFPSRNIATSSLAINCTLLSPLVLVLFVQAPWFNSNYIYATSG